MNNNSTQHQVSVGHEFWNQSESATMDRRAYLNSLRRQIQNGTYPTAEHIELAVEAILPVIEGRRAALGAA